MTETGYNASPRCGMVDTFTDAIGFIDFPIPLQAGIAKLENYVVD